MYDLWNCAERSNLGTKNEYCYDFTSMDHTGKFIEVENRIEVSRNGGGFQKFGNRND